MIHTVIFDNEIKVWWDYIKLYDGDIFNILLNDKKIGSTVASHFNILGLSEKTKYTIKVELIDNKAKKKKTIGEESVTTKYAKKRIDVTKPPYNAINDGTTLNTLAVQRAIEDCGKDESVYFPDGKYLIGAVNLKSNLEILLSDNAEILGSVNEQDYLPKIVSRYEGEERLCYRSLFNAGILDNKTGSNCENILIRGGKIHGGGEELRLNCMNAERDRLLKEKGFQHTPNPPFYYSTALPARTRGRLFEFNNTKNVIIANTECGDGPAWNLHFIYCENIITCGCKIVSQGISNGDGWNPDSSVDCVIFDVVFETGDDCVAIKSGKNREGNLIGRASKHIRVFDVCCRDGHGIAIGSEMSGGIEDVVIWNCNIMAGTGIYFKSSVDRGGYIKNVKVYNCYAPTVSVCTSYCLNSDDISALNIPKISALTFEDITLTGVGKFTGDHRRIEPEIAFMLTGLSAENPISDVLIKNITLKYRPMLPFQNVYLQNVKDVILENIICLGEI